MTVLKVVTIPMNSMASPEVQLSGAESAMSSSNSSHQQLLKQQQQQQQHHHSGSVLAQSTAGNRMVLAKPLQPNQTLPSSILSNLVSMATPSSVNCKKSVYY